MNVECIMFSLVLELLNYGYLIWNFFLSTVTMLKMHSKIALSKIINSLY